MAVDFYRRLFTADPSAEALFTDEPGRDGREVRRRARRHRARPSPPSRRSHPGSATSPPATSATACRPSTTTSVGEALIGALAAHLAPDWDDALEAAWRRAYNLVAEVMMATAAERERARHGGAPVGRPARTARRGRCRLTFRSLVTPGWRRTGLGLGPAHAGPHRTGDDVPSSHPGVADRWGEPFAETLLECPQQGRADDVEMLVSHAVAHVAGAQPDEERADDVEVPEPVDGGLHRRHRPLRLRARCRRRTGPGFPERA